MLRQVLTAHRVCSVVSGDRQQYGGSFSQRPGKDAMGVSRGEAMAVTFTPKVQWPENSLRLKAADFGIKVPTGLSEVHLREPNFVDVTVMSAKSKEHAVGQEAPCPSSTAW